MGMTLVHGCLNFKYLSKKEITLREFTNAVALAMRAKEGRWCGDGGVVLGAQQQSCLQSMCKMCFEGMIVALSLCMEDPKVFWVCCPGKHGRQCYAI